MEITVKLGKQVACHEIRVEVPSSTSLVADVLSSVRSQLPATLIKVIGKSENAGATLFLSLHPDGPERMSEEAKLSDYSVADGCTLWLMCSHFLEEDDAE